MSKPIQERKPNPSPLDQFAARLDEWFFLATPAKTLAYARKQLLADGFSTSLDSLSRWRSRRAWEREQEDVNDWAEEFEQQVREFKPGETEDNIRQFVISFLMKKAAATGNHQLALEAIGKQQQEISARTKAAQKERELALAEGKWAWIQKEDLDRALDALHAEIKNNAEALAAFQTFKTTLRHAQKA
jgi:hypothetical protein